MIEKGRSNNKSIYMLLAVVMLVLAGTAYGVMHMLTGNEIAKKDGGSTNVVEQTAQVKTEAVKESKGMAVAHAEQSQAHDYRILIKKSDFKLYVLDNGAIVETFGCALGKNTGDKEKSGDMKTPNGTFNVIEVCDASYWTHDFKDGKGEIKGAYGPWFFYLDTNEKSKGQWDGIGIHGTHDPASIGTLASEGCIRLLNENVELLKTKYIKVGTKVTIEE